MGQFYSAKRRVTMCQIITVTADTLDTFGQGVARNKGNALFISVLFPGKSAEVTLTEEKKQYACGQIKRRLNDSPQRETARCPRFGVCGSVALKQQSKRAALLRRDVDKTIADMPWYTSDGLRLMFSPRDFIRQYRA